MSYQRLCYTGFSPLSFQFIFKIIFIYSLLAFDSLANVEYEMSISNPELINDNVYEFDIMIKSLNESFLLTSYQASFGFSQNIINSGEINFFYKEGTSDLQNTPTIGLGINGTDGSLELTFASLPGEESINTEQIRVGRFRLENTNSFGSSNLNINWNFEGAVTTILTGEGFNNITNPIYHKNELQILAPLQVVNVIASDTTENNHGPEKTIDGLGYYDGDPDSRWSALPTPQFLIFDIGYEKLISLTRFSFGNFQGGRIYQYSIFLSSDMVNWNEVISNASSQPQEWTENEFSPQSARYVKLLLISNNQNDWATVWEAQVWGYTGTTDIEDEDNIEKPQNFELSQNYPNPFNPGTNIRFSLPENGKVKLTVFNILGEVVSELINQELNMGTHEITFDGGNLASGIYVYRLDVENQFLDIKKMILVK